MQVACKARLAHYELYLFILLMEGHAIHPMIILLVLTPCHALYRGIREERVKRSRDCQIQSHEYLPLVFF